MPIDVIMPQLGESIFEGTLTKWLKKVGDSVALNEPLFEISTDKVDSEIASPADGVLSRILVAAGKVAQVGSILAILVEGETESKATSGEVLATPLPALPEAYAMPDDTPPEAAAQPPHAVVIDLPPAGPDTLSDADIRTSPLVRRMAREHGIDLTTIHGTGLSGRITRKDILRLLESPDVKGRVSTAEPVADAVEVPQPAPPLPEPWVPEAPEAARPLKTEPALQTDTASPQKSALPGSVDRPAAGEATETIAMTAMRKAIAERMLLSRRTSAHVQTVFEVDMTAIVGLREKHKDEFAVRAGVKLTYTAFIASALVNTLRDYPILNSSVSGDQIILKKSMNLGIAVALDSGLIVPVVKDAQTKTFTELAVAIHDLAERARAKRLSPEEVQNGTITITNPGIFGSLFGTPIINQPQVAILDVGTIEKRPVVVNDAIAIRTMAYLVLSFDHRVIDGAVADQFMAALKARLQNWTAWVE